MKEYKSMLTMLDRARLIAKLVHLDETRRNGELYHNHCDRVEESLKDKDEVIRSVAQLHDVLENVKNPNLIRLLLAEYFPFEVTHLVETLTNDKNTPYSRYIEIVCNDSSAFMIKMADMIDNTSDEIPEKQFNKYRESVIYMISKGKDIPKVLKERLKIEE